jgi:hypothetical protein
MIFPQTGRDFDLIKLKIERESSRKMSMKKKI